ncbi:MAG TPA: organomercurial lyase [Actinomycetota bacterium]|nr:organomercurial lyase [Actinomycetota bacterium]
MDPSAFDRQVRLSIYRAIVEDGRPPTAPELAGTLDVPAAGVEDAFRRLADGRAIVLAPGTPYVWMANPFSAIPTPFEVRVGDRGYFGNCIWDALGIPACLHEDAQIRTFCPDCSEPISLEVRGDMLAAPAGATIHFAVPAAHWWEDIGAT